MMISVRDTGRQVTVSGHGSSGLVCGRGLGDAVVESVTPRAYATNTAAPPRTDRQLPVVSRFVVPGKAARSAGHWRVSAHGLDLPQEPASIEERAQVLAVGVAG